MKPRARELASKAWQRLRGGELTPARAAASVAVGVAVGVTPLWGLHWAILLAVCLPLHLDAGVAWLAANVSLPFFAPFITFAEIQVGARLLAGRWPTLSVEEASRVRPADLAAELAVGTTAVAVGGAALAGAATWGLVTLVRARRARGAGSGQERLG